MNQKNYVESPYFREALPFSDTIPFGMELEYERALYDLVQKRINSYLLTDAFESKRDSSVTTNRTTRGGEVSSAILYNKKETWEKLRLLIHILETSHAIITGKTSFQISLDRSIFRDSKEALVRFLKLWALYEEEIYYQSFGEMKEARTEAKHWAIPCGNLFMDYLTQYISERTSIDQIWTDLFLILHGKLYARMYGLSIDLKSQALCEGKDRIEIRIPNGSLNEFIIQNTLYFFVSLIGCCHNNSLDWDYIEKEYRTYQQSFGENNAIEKQSWSHYCLYGPYQKQILMAGEDVKKAQDLQNMLYKTALDKELFMKQYLKKL